LGFQPDFPDNSDVERGIERGRGRRERRERGKRRVRICEPIVLISSGGVEEEVLLLMHVRPQPQAGEVEANKRSEHYSFALEREEWVG
jgi:hypothetical protein